MVRYLAQQRHNDVVFVQDVSVTASPHSTTQPSMDSRCILAAS